MAIHQRSKSLAAMHSELADTFFQLEVLNGRKLVDSKIPLFIQKTADAGYFPLKPSRIDIFQINIGKLCNQTCAHCHVDAGPDKKVENMSRATLEKCLDILSRYDIPTVDITGGAPEMNPNFRWFVEECHKLGKTVMDRCNLTIIMSNPKYADLPQFFAKNEVQVVSSLPYFKKNKTDAQRGDGVFEDSIKALQALNQAGYGRPGSPLILNLVYNPSGSFLPGNQPALEAEFKRELKQKFDIEFNQLFAITNMPISRYLDHLLQTNNYHDYMQLLVDAFNPSTLSGVMCRNTLSISWDGYIYDCDFNQMLDLKVASPSNHIDRFDWDALASRDIVLNQHCYGCTAGAGSSCGGEIVS